jgi:hypothetical protein
MIHIHLLLLLHSSNRNSVYTDRYWYQPTCINTVHFPQGILTDPGQSFRSPGLTQRAEGDQRKRKREYVPGGANGWRSRGRGGRGRPGRETRTGSRVRRRPRPPRRCGTRETAAARPRRRASGATLAGRPSPSARPLLCPPRRRNEILGSLLVSPGRKFGRRRTRERDGDARCFVVVLSCGTAGAGRTEELRRCLVRKIFCFWLL